MVLERRIRGDVNAALNRLIDDGVLVGFESEWDNGQNTGHVVIIAGSATNSEAALEVVRRALRRFADRVTVSLKAG